LLLTVALSLANVAQSCDPVMSVMIYGSRNVVLGTVQYVRMNELTALVGVVIIAV